MLDKGGFKTEVYGVGTDDWGQTWKDRKDTLPPSVTYLTDSLSPIFFIVRSSLKRFIP